MKLHQFILAAALATGMAACATVNNPDGGPEDTSPPKLRSSNPADQALNVDTKEIILVFDEEVQPKNLNKELLITPDTDNKYQVRTDREKIILRFEKDFEENTTYTFNFREGIEDITKPNKAENLKLTFSTGTYLDSSNVSGNVKNLMTQAPEKNAVVALYDANDTLTVRKNRPYYQTITDEAGNFNLENLKEGLYKVYAIVDKNKNSIYDSEEERIAYLPEPVHITPLTKDIQLQTVRIDTKRPILSKRENFADRFTANYNEGIRKLTATAIPATKDTLQVKLSADGKAADLFKTTTFSGGKTILAAVDSAGNIAVDTIQIAFQGKRAQRIRGAQLKVMNTGAGTQTYSVGQDVVLELETPVRITGQEPVNILADSISQVKLKYPQDLKLDKTNTELSFKLPKLNGKGSNYSIMLDSTAIVPLEGERLQFAPLSFEVANTSGTGNLSGTVKTDKKSYFIQLLNDKNIPVREVRNVQKFSFRNIQPGQYTIRVLIDQNNNGIWDGPNRDLETLPEPIYIYLKQLDVRANWDIEDNIIEF